MAFADLLAADQIELEEHYPNAAEHRADLIVHVVGLAAALIGGAVLFTFAVLKGEASLATSLSLYAVCLLAMLSCSAVYNLTKPNRARRVLRRLDEAAIFLMIAGSYTPFTTHLQPDALAVGATSLIWMIAVGGAVAKLLAPNLSDRVWSFVYMGFGWLAVLMLQPLATTLPMSAILLLAAGGLVYSVGVLFFLRPTLPYRRAIWHGFVVCGAGVHYAAILTGVVLPALAA